MERVRTLEDLLHSRLDEIHVTNTQLKTMLPNAANVVHNEDLKDRLTKYLARSGDQNKRIEDILNTLEWKPAQTPHNASSGLMQDMGDLLENSEIKPAVMDAAILSFVQRIQHHHIADFGCMRTWAKLLGFDEPAEMLQTCLDEEKISDTQLTSLARTVVNQQAAEVNVGAEVK